MTLCTLRQPVFTFTFYLNDHWFWCFHWDIYLYLMPSIPKLWGVFFRWIHTPQTEFARRCLRRCDSHHFAQQQRLDEVTSQWYTQLSIRSDELESPTLFNLYYRERHIVYQVSSKISQLTLSWQTNTKLGITSKTLHCMEVWKGHTHHLFSGLLPRHTALTLNSLPTPIFCFSWPM